MVASRDRQRSQAPEVLERIEELVGDLPDVPAAAIQRVLEAEFGDRAPRTVRTTQDIVQSLRPPAAMQVWNVLDEPDPARISVAMPVLAAVIANTGGRRLQLSVREVDAVVAIHAAAPDISPWQQFRFARAYLFRRDRALPTYDLDSFLAIAPWRSDDGKAGYRQALRERRLPPPPWRLLVALVPLEGESERSAPPPEAREALSEIQSPGRPKIDTDDILKTLPLGLPDIVIDRNAPELLRRLGDLSHTRPL